MTRERVRQIEKKALRRLQARAELLQGRLAEYASGDLDADDRDLAQRSSMGLRKT